MESFLLLCYSLSLILTVRFETKKLYISFLFLLGYIDGFKTRYRKELIITEKSYRLTEKRLYIFNIDFAFPINFYQ